MSDISKLPARQVDQSHDTLAGLAREVLEKWEQANKEPRHTHLKHDNWMIYDIITTAGHLATQAWQPFHEYSRSSQDAEYHVAAANAAPQLATAYLEMQAELQARERDFVAQQQMLLDLANALKRAEDAEAEFKQWHDRAIELQTAVIGRDQYIKEQQAENEQLREEIKKLLHLAELDYQRAFDGLSSGQYIIALDSVLGIAESAKTVAQRALAQAGEQP